jgi:hypothetical protein
MNQLAPLLGLGESGDTQSSPFGMSPLAGGGITGLFKSLMPGQQTLPNAAYTPTNIYSGFPGLDPAAGQGGIPGIGDLGAGGLGNGTPGQGGWRSLTNIIPGLGDQTGQAPGPSASGAPAPASDSGAAQTEPQGNDAPAAAHGLGGSHIGSVNNFHFNPQGIASQQHFDHTVQKSVIDSGRGLSAKAPVAIKT